MAAPAMERSIDEMTVSLTGDPDELCVFEVASDQLQRVVQFDGSAWFATDPTTILAVCPVRIENIESGHCETYWDREANVEDAMLFRDLARSETGVDSLYRATDGNPLRSARYREFLAPQGYGDELRAALRIGSTTWGLIDLYRRHDRAPFSAVDRDIVQSLVPVMASALRALAVSGRVRADASERGPGNVLFDARGTLLSLDQTAEKLFEELAGPHWVTRPMMMTPVYAAVARAVAISEERDRGPATARIRASTGRWLIVHASRMCDIDGDPGLVAVTIEPAKSAQIAPIIVEAYCLTAREQEITRAVARGLSNPEIAVDLNLSPHTVRDHLKAIFGKVGVSSRGELVAKLFAEHYGPALHAPDALVRHVEY
jgi:DNA-binding CsgD family transcriptional regulator